MADVMRQRRAALGISQAELAAAVGVDVRQVRRYEAGTAHPLLPVARAIADTLQISVDELAGAEPAGAVDLTGDWWAAWQTWNRGRELVNVHELRMRQRGDHLALQASTRGNQEPDRGGYLWRGELRLYDNTVLMGHYVATEGAVRSKGTMFFTLHQHGQSAAGRWVGLSYDGPIITGWGALARTENGVTTVMDELLAEGWTPA